jgi:hypothetical protein
MDQIEFARRFGTPSHPDGDIALVTVALQTAESRLKIAILLLRMILEFFPVVLPRSIQTILDEIES